MKMRCLIGLSCLMLLSGMSAPTARADTVLYSEDFSDGVANGFVSTPAGSFTVANGTYNNALSMAATGTSIASSSVNLSNYTAGQDFSISTNFTLNSFTQDAPASNNAVNAGFGFLGSSSDLNAGNRYRVVYGIDGSGTTPSTGLLTLVASAGGTNTTLATSTVAVAPIVGGFYTLTVTGTFVGTTLNLSSTLTNGANSTTVNSSSTLLTGLGSNFGFRDGLSKSSASPTTAALDVSYDNFSVTAVPEPTTLAMFAMGGLGLAGRLRRRRTA